MKTLQRSIASEFPCAKYRHNNNESVYIKEHLALQESILETQGIINYQLTSCGMLARAEAMLELIKAEAKDL